MENKGLVFRRINGRIVPIRTKNAVAPKKREDAIERSAKVGVAAGGSAAGAIYGASKAARSWFGKRIESLAEQLKQYPRKNPPMKPSKSRIFNAVAKKIDPEIRGTALGSMSINKQVTIKLAEAQSRYSKRLADFSVNRHIRTNLRFERIKFINYQNRLIRNTPKAVVIGALGVGAVAAGIALLKNSTKKRK